jgi:DoxX-like family
METISKPKLWTGRIMSGLVIFFMLFDAVLKFLKPEPVIQTTINILGYADHHILVHGFLALIPTILYAIPRTSVLGAVLLTGYLGGAIASNLRIDAPLFSHILFPVYVGILLWGGIWLRTPRLQNLFPIEK